MSLISLNDSRDTLMNLHMYDLHSHILPGLDDGPKAIDDTMAMARVAAQQGTRVMVCTPHRKDVGENSSVDHVRELVAGINRDLEGEGVALEFLVGMENHLDLDLPADLAAGKALPLNGTRYCLVELPFFGRPNYLEDVLFQIQLQGITPVLAHPERIEAVQNDVGLLAKFVERGMLSQVTAGSVVGHFGKKVRTITHSMLRQRLVHILASDTHFPAGPRSPELREGVEAAASIVGEAEAEAMVVDTPRRIVEDLPVEIEPPRQDEGRGRRWFFFRR